MENKVDLGRYYIITILLLLVIGTAWTIANNGMDSVRFAGVIIAVASCSVINLIYFIPTRKLILRLLLPGIVSSLIFFFINKGSSVERTFFTAFGIINLLIGIMWLIVKGIKK